MSVSVYLIEALTGRSDGPVKFGIAADPLTRLKSLQTSSPFELRLIHALVFPKREIAKDVEEIIHDACEEHRTVGEWFLIEPTTALYAFWFYTKEFLKIIGESRFERMDVVYQSVGLDSAEAKLIASLKGAAQW